MNTHHRSVPVAVALVLAVAACRSGPETDGAVLVVEDTISSLSTDAAGDTWIAFGPGARAFVILSERTDLLGVARDAFAHGKPVRATVHTGHGAKTSQAAAATVTVTADDKRRIRVEKLEIEGPR